MRPDEHDVRDFKTAQGVQLPFLRRPDFHVSANLRTSIAGFDRGRESREVGHGPSSGCVGFGRWRRRATPSSPGAKRRPAVLADFERRGTGVWMVVAWYMLRAPSTVVVVPASCLYEPGEAIAVIASVNESLIVLRKDFPAFAIPQGIGPDGRVKVCRHGVEARACERQGVGRLQLRLAAPGRRSGLERNGT